jgi:hypothetical protein
MRRSPVEITGTGPERRALSRPDGEGQATGHARNARGEPGYRIRLILPGWHAKLAIELGSASVDVEAVYLPERVTAASMNMDAMSAAAVDMQADYGPRRQ